ncbi:MAG TPA: hypothetical protein VGM07_05165 [Stellaceae bacterium]|jgi:hypothetical protein
MPDGSINVRIVADTAGFDIDPATQKLAELRVAAEQAKQSLRASASDFASSVKSLEEAGGATDAQMKNLMADAVMVGEKETAAAAATKVFKDALKGSGEALGNLGQESKHIIAIFDEFSRGARGQMVGSMVAMARDSGLLGKAIGALRSPIGIAVIATVGLTGALYELERAAMAAARALQNTYNSAFSMGRDAAAAEAHVKAMVPTLENLGIGQGAALQAASGIEGITHASEKAKENLNGIVDAFARVNTEGDLDKATKQLAKLFSSAASMKRTIEENPQILTGAHYQQFQAMLQPGATIEQLKSAGDLMARGIADYYGRAQSAVSQKTVEFNQSLTEAAAATGSLPASMFGVKTALPTNLSERLPPPLHMASDAEIAADQAIAEGNRLQNERAAALANVRDIQGQITAGTRANNDATRNAIDYWNKRAADISKQLGQQDQDVSVGGKAGSSGQLAVMDGFREKLEEQNAAIAGTVKTAKDARAAMLANDIKYWSAVLAGDKLSAQQRAEVQMELFRSKETAEIQAMPHGGGGRAGGGSGKAAQTQDYDAYAEGERQKIEAARSAGQSLDGIYTEWAAHAATIYGQDSAQFRRVMVEKAAAARQASHQIAEAAEQAYSGQRSADQAYLAAFKASMAALVAQHKISKQQEIGFDIEYTAQLRDQLRAQLQAVIDNDNLTKADRQRAWQEMMTLSADYGAKIAEDQARSAEATATSWTRAVSKISDQFATMATDMITRTKSITASFDEMMRSLIKDTLQSTFKSLFSSILGGGDSGSGAGGGSGGGSGLNLMSLLFGSGGIGSMLFGKGGLSGMLGLGEGGVLGSLTGSAGGGLLSGLFGGGSGGNQDFSGGTLGPGGSVGGDVASAAGGGLLSTLFGGLFKGVGSLFGMGGGLGSLFGFSKGGIVPSAAGGWAVPQLGPGGMLANVHSNEMVLPAPISQGLQGAIAGGGFGGGGHTFNIGISSATPGDTARLFMSNGSALVSALNNAIRNGSSLRTS